MHYKLGIDAGSTTIKFIILDNYDNVIYKSYKRHYSKVRECLLEEVIRLEHLIKDKDLKIAITGSSGYGISHDTGIAFVQEVFATTLAIKREKIDIDVAIELGGEDAKIIFLTNGFEERMNSTCAGGTGAFIDQMAQLMDISVIELDKLSLNYNIIYPIASRCGVFAKSDIQPLLNQGAKKEDISASIFQSVVDQTIGGLAQGRKIQGSIMMLGGPLYFYKGLRNRFIETLNVDKKQIILPSNGQVFVAFGCALYAGEESKVYDYSKFIEIIKNKPKKEKSLCKIPCLFKNKEEYKKFNKRHDEAKVSKKDINSYKGDAYLGIDAGSTTTKLVLLDDNSNILYEYYSQNKGNPVKIAKEQLEYIYSFCGDKINIKSTGVTGYGEELLKKAFNIDFGIVETVAHFIAAKHFNPKVDFILDIGGQDIKCFKIRNGIVTNIMLNEACSSGCGSFIETFAKQMGYSVEEFTKIGLFAKNIVDLGSRCTVFMNSSVKQAQKDGASIEDLSASLSISVVKNALYKVIRAKNVKELGENIIVQGGTMYNDAILRSFEQELGLNVIRPNISGLMGAYGVALYAKEHSKGSSTLLGVEELSKFTHTSKVIKCGLCTNKCNLTINTFSGKNKYISGNRCQRPEGNNSVNTLPNIYEYKYNKINSLGVLEGHRGEIGIPVVLNMYENLPFWSSFFEKLGFKVTLSDQSSKKLYAKGQYTIPSDTVCYPAKLTHGHIENLLNKNVEYIFYPCMSYNFDEGISDNCFNCPIVAYYPELLEANMKRLKDIKFIAPYVCLNNKKLLIKKLYKVMNKTFNDITLKEIKEAVKSGYEAYELFKEDIRLQGEKALEFAKNKNLITVVLAGRPYHVDSEINHGIDKLLTKLGVVVITEDCISGEKYKPNLNILNQWTYQARLYSAADFVRKTDKVEMIQLVSFGCGTDAITTDEIKDILENNNKIYTQLKIDETSNLGAAKIRIRSMLEAISQK